MQGNTVQFTGQMSEQMLPHEPANNSPSQVMGMQGQVWQPSGPGTCGPSSYMAQQHGDPASTANNMSACLKWCLMLASSKPTWSTHLFLPPTHTRAGHEEKQHLGKTTSQAMGCLSMHLSLEHPMVSDVLGSESRLLSK